MLDNRLNIRFLLIIISNIFSKGNYIQLVVRDEPA